MASPSSLFQFVVYAQDHTDEGASQRRLDNRTAQLDFLKKLRDDGVIKTGGAALDPDALKAGTEKMVGTFIAFEAESLEAVRNIVEESVYYTANVWDKEKIIIVPVALVSNEANAIPA